MAIPKIFNTFALNLNKITMDDLNRLKVVLVEQKKTGKSDIQWTTGYNGVLNLWEWNSTILQLEAW